MLLVEDLHDLGEIQQRTAQSVHFVHDDAIDLAGRDVGQQTLEGWSVHVPTGETTIVVVLGQALPSFVLLAGDVRLARLPLGVEGIELLFEPLFGGLSRVDGASHCGGRFLLLWVFGSSFALQPEESVAIAVGARDGLGHCRQGLVAVAVEFQAVGENEDS